MKNGIIGVLVLCLVGSILYVSPISNDIQKLLTGTRCLKDTEKAVYEILEEGRPGKVRVNVVDTVASTTVWSKDFSIPSTSHSRAYLLHRCHFYLHERDGFNPENGEVDPGYFWGLLQHKYFSEDGGKRVVTFAENSSGKSQDSKVFYGTTYSISDGENYASLERSTLSKPDYALVIKNIETGADEYILTLAEVLKEHPEAAGSFDVGKWVTRPDGEYLKTVIYDGARELAYIYIKADTWETEIFETPTDLMAGVEGAIPPFAPLLAYTDVIVWAGFAEMTEQLIDEQISSGQKKHLIVANLKTGKKAVIETVPIIKSHRFKMTWLSDTELEYTMPDGTKKTYQVEE